MICSFPLLISSISIFIIFFIFMFISFKKANHFFLTHSVFDFFDKFFLRNKIFLKLKHFE